MGAPLGFERRLCNRGARGRDGSSGCRRASSWGLYEEGLIYFFRLSSLDINAAGEDEALRLDDGEVHESLAGGWWRGRELAPDVTTVWWGPTAEGEKACDNPPADIRSYWESRYPPKSE